MYNGVDWRSGPGLTGLSVEFVWVFVQHRIHHPQPVPLTISLKVSLPIHCMRVAHEVVVSSFDTERSSGGEGFISDREFSSVF